MKTLAELQAIRDKKKAEMLNRTTGENNIRIVVGMATCGIAAGARPVLQAFGEEIESRKLENVTLGQTGCIGLCKYEPIVEVFVPGQEKVTYVHMDAQKAREVISSHILNGKPITEYTFKG